MQRLTLGGRTPVQGGSGMMSLSSGPKSYATGGGSVDLVGMYRDGLMTPYPGTRGPGPTGSRPDTPAVQGGGGMMRTAVQPGSAVYGQPQMRQQGIPRQAASGMPANSGMGDAFGGNSPSWDTNKNFILQQVQSGNATPGQQAWYDRWVASGQPHSKVGMIPRESYSVVPRYGAGEYPETGIRGAENALRGGLEGGLAAVQNGMTDANSRLDPYARGGVGASQYAQALTGALGESAQAAAFNRYMESPEQAYLREQSEKAITRNAAATGGLQGGNVLQELQRNAIGLASQDFQNSFDRLMGVSDRGQKAASQQAGYNFDAGTLGANMAYGTGNTLAAGRTRAGELLAGNMASLGAGQANLIDSGSRNLSSTIGEQSGNLANLLTGAGNVDNETLTRLAELLANASMTAAGAGRSNGLGSTQQTGGVLAGGDDNMLGTLGSILQSIP